MKEIKINLKLNIREDLDEQDVLDQTAVAVKRAMSYEPSGLVEFIDAELQETDSAGRITGINITDIIDDLVKVYTNLGEDAEDATGRASCDGAVKVLGAFKDLLERHNLAALAPAAELDQLHGENLMLAMRLDKAEKLLDGAVHYLTRYSNKFPELVAPAMDINEFLGGTGK
jgi:hypothetical protein